MADVLGTTLKPGDANWAHESTAGFDNIAAVQRIDDKQYKHYYDAAVAVAADVFASATAKAKVVTCAKTDDAACIDSVVNATGLRLFRRPLTAEEVTTYHKVYTDARTLGLTHEPALPQVVVALLASAEFLFRMEFDQDPASSTIHDLSGYELASRLSYFLWQSAPDDALLATAADLPKTETLTAQYDRAVADARVRTFDARLRRAVARHSRRRHARGEDRLLPRLDARFGRSHGRRGLSILGRVREEG